MSISGIQALTPVSVDTGFAMGFVDIDIETYELNSDNQEVEYTDKNRNYLPGNVISIIPKVVNKGTDCFVRIKVFFADDETNIEEYAVGLSTKFKKIRKVLLL